MSKERHVVVGGGAGPLAGRVLTLLQFTRAALVFTALADCLAALLLRAAVEAGGERGGALARMDWVSAGAAMGMSCCLYLFGMALNDLVDHRKDAVGAATRPIPSGRLGVPTAHAVVTVLGVGALAMGSVYAWRTDSVASMALLLGVVALINFYNFAGKYLVSVGILTLGLVRAVHVTVVAPEVPVVWHGLTLFTHVAVVSVVAYVWEEKRPRLTPLHSAVLAAGVVGVNVAAVAGVLSMKWDEETGKAGIAAVLALTPGLVAVVAATGVFAGLARWIARGVDVEGTPRAVGARLSEAEEGTTSPGGGVAGSRAGSGASWGNVGGAREWSGEGEPRAAREVGPGAGGKGGGESPDAVEEAGSVAAPAPPEPAPLRARRRRAGQKLMLAGLLYLIVYDALFVGVYAGWSAGLVVGALLPVAYSAVRVMRWWSGLKEIAKPPRFRPAPM